MTADAIVGSGGKKRKTRLNNVSVGTAAFSIYIFFLLEAFLHFSARIPGLGVFRPTLLSALVLALMLLAGKRLLLGRYSNEPSRYLRIFAVYLCLSLPFVTWPGSVLGNASDFVRSIAFFFFTVAVIDTEKRLNIFLWVFVGCQVFRVLEPLYLNVTQGYWGSSTYLGGGEFAGRLSGAPSDVINPNELGFVIVTAIPFLYYLLMPGGWKAKLLFLAVMPCLLYALMLTMSRGAFLALLVVAFFVFRDSSRRGMLAIIAVIGLVSLWSVMTPVQKDRYLSLVDDNTAGAASREGRIHGMIKEFKLGMTRPVFGHGLGTTSEAKANKLGRRQASHNFYAELLIEVGVIGSVIFLGFMRSVYRIVAYGQGKLKLAADFPVVYSRLGKAMVAVFWMYVVYSFNYWGLSQYYWYLLGGLAVASLRLMELRTVDGAGRGNG